MLLTLVAAATLAATPVKLAAPGLTYVGVDEKSGVFFLDFLAQQLRGHGLEVTTQSQIAAVLGLERQKQLLGCTEESSSCLAELAGALGVDGVLSGSLARTGRGTYVINLNVVGATDGTNLASGSTRVGSDDELLDWLTTAAREMAPLIVSRVRKGSTAARPSNQAASPAAPGVPGRSNVTPVPPVPEAPRVADGALLPPVPTAPSPPSPSPSHASSGGLPGPSLSEGVRGPPRLAAWIVGGAGAALAITSGGFLVSAHVLRGELDRDPPPITRPSQLAWRLEQIQTRNRVSGILGAIAGAALATSGVLLLWPSAPAAQIVLLPSGAHVGFAWTLP